jgi:hypothetical protein
VSCWRGASGSVPADSRLRAQDRGQGLFDVTFTGIATGPSGGRFLVLASAMVEDPYSSHCNVARWTISGADLIATVTCWHEDGLPDEDAFYLFVIQ